MLESSYTLLLSFRGNWLRVPEVVEGGIGSGPDFIGIRRNPMKFGSDLVGFHHAPLNFDEIRTGFRSKGIREKTCRIRSDFYERCRIPMKSDTDPIENDRIYRSDHLTWVPDCCVPSNSDLF